MPRSSAVNLLVRAYSLIKDESGWTQHNLATDRKDRPVPASDPEAFCFCARGAMSRAHHELKSAAVHRRDAERVVDQESRRLFGWGIVCVNDGRRGEARQSRSGSHKRVVMAFEEAIKVLGGEVPR